MPALGEVTSTELREQFAARLRAIADGLDHAANEVDRLHHTGHLPIRAILVSGPKGAIAAVQLLGSLVPEISLRLNDVEYGFGRRKERQRQNTRRLRERNAEDKKQTKRKHT